MVVSSVERREVFIAETGNSLRLAAGIEAVHGIGKDRTVGPLADDGFEAGIITLHLVEDHTVDTPSAGLIGHEAIAFLEEELPF